MERSKRTTEDGAAERAEERGRRNLTGGRRLTGERTLALTAFLLGIFCLLTALAAFGRREASSEEVFQAFETANFSRIDCRIYRGSASGEGVCLEMEGRLPGRLSREEQRGLAEALLERMGARRVAGVDEETLYTVYAYAKGAGATKTLPEGEVNLNLAVSYDELEDETVFHLGCPILVSDW
ncbi:MAG: hypothetical protein HFI64_06420 [Lachnospiraceae bacterium]|nr:hypothetical protein [Lachnospiraceae bacterium]